MHEVHGGGYKGAHLMHHNQVIMQPNYNSELSKTSRTLAAEDGAELQNQYIRGAGGPIINAKNSGIRRVPRIHRRSRARKIPYYERKHRAGQRVSISNFDINLFVLFRGSSRSRGRDRWQPSTLLPLGFKEPSASSCTRRGRTQAC
jgi:hypothetical protein